MTQEEKKLLIKVICEMMPYGIIVHRKSDNRDLEFMDVDPMESMDRFVHCFDTQSELDDMELYLRPISSMTEEEQKEFVGFHCVNLCPIVMGEMLTLENETMMFDWLNEHHFDYRGLVERGLAMEAPEGMYQTKNRAI